MTDNPHHQEYGRLLIRNGRAWLPLTDADVERGMRAVIADPTYRAEIARSALAHASEIGDPVLHARIREAWAGLANPDQNMTRSQAIAAGLLVGQCEFCHDDIWSDREPYVMLPSGHAHCACAEEMRGWLDGV